MIRPDNPYIDYTGRFDFSNKSEALCAWSASAITARFTGRSCAVYLRDDTGNNFVSIFADDAAPIVVRMGTKPQRVNVPLVGNGEHAVTVFKRTEASQGILYFKGLEIDRGAKMLPIVPHTMMIEFIGDSITCGYGNEAADGTEPFRPETENSYTTYAAIAARELGAGLVTICMSGKGIVRDNYGSPVEPMTELYDRVYPQKHAKAARIQRADIAVINLGSNDFATGLPDQRTFVDAYLILIEKIRKNHPHAALVILDGPLVSNDWPFPGALDRYREYISCVIREAREHGPGKTLTFSLSAQGARGFGADYHPNAAQHRYNGLELASFLRGITNLSND
jgi:lysophospholipase L1-like esterase